MVSFHAIALASFAIIHATSTFPTEIAGRQNFTPGVLNNTQEFYITMRTTESCLEKYNGWQIETYHTGAGLADPVFAPNGSRAFLNGTNLQFDVGPYPFSMDAEPGDTNYARWEPVTIGISYGSGDFVDTGDHGLESTNPEFGGWIVCEWFHGINAPQLFQSIVGFNTEPTVLPGSCANVYLTLDYF